MSKWFLSNCNATFTSIAKPYFGLSSKSAMKASLMKTHHWKMAQLGTGQSEQSKNCSWNLAYNF
jgi:hypothetical protein